MTVLESVKDFIAEYSGLQQDSESDPALFVDHLKSELPSYSIDPIPAQVIIEEYIDESALCQFVFAFRVNFSTFEESTRLENSGFFEDFSAWLRSQTNSGNLPSLEAGKVARKIEARSWGTLFEQGESEAGIYQIQCVLEYKQPSPAQEVEESL